MKSTIYVVRNDNGGESKYLTEYKINETHGIFSGSWNADVNKALEFERKEDAVALATRLKNDWNGRKFKALQKCKCMKKPKAD